jgi:hypothetical protein
MMIEDKEELKENRKREEGGRSKTAGNGGGSGNW